jgi:hypothetical protein
MSGHHDYENGYKRGFDDGQAFKADLLAACEAILGVIDAANATGTHTKADGPIANQLRAAIAKAKGEKE